MRKIYTILFYLALPFIFLRLLWRSKRIPAYRKNWGERLGYGKTQLTQCIWIHVVSVGETIAAIPLIKELQKNYPDIPLFVTNMTPTGAERVKAAFGNSVYHAYIPYDVPCALHRFLKRINPVIAIIMETELWPNLFKACHDRAIPVVVINARLSQKSATGYQRIPSLNRILFAAITRLAAQSQQDGERFVKLGLHKDKLSITGNLKFDLQLPENLTLKSELLYQSIGQDRLIWIAASTHPGEEDIILQAHHVIKATIPSALLILVPRHPDRFAAIQTLVKQAGFSMYHRSSQAPYQEPVDVYVGDTMGELLLLYSVADVAFVGGSFAPIGGHNMLEPAILHKPILTGPQLYNFSEISELLIKAKGMQVVKNKDELATAVIALLQDPYSRLKMAENAYQVMALNRGALKRQLELIEDVITESRKRFK